MCSCMREIALCVVRENRDAMAIMHIDGLLMVIDQRVHTLYSVISVVLPPYLPSNCHHG